LPTGLAGVRTLRWRLLRGLLGRRRWRQLQIVVRAETVFQKTRLREQPPRVVPGEGVRDLVHPRRDQIELLGKHVIPEFAG